MRGEVASDPYEVGIVWDSNDGGEWYRSGDMEIDLGSGDAAKELSLGWAHRQVAKLERSNLMWQPHSCSDENALLLRH